MATVSYLRVSTSKQDEASQRHAIRAAVGDVEREFVDHGISGRRASRPGLDALRAWVREGDVVAVYALSRLGRSTQDLLTLLNEFDAQGVTVRSLSESIDMSTPGGRLVVTVLAAVAEMEADITRERVRAGLAAARAEGRTFGRPRLDPALLTQGLALVDDGMSVREAAERVGVSRSSLYEARAARKALIAQDA